MYTFDNLFTLFWRWFNSNQVKVLNKIIIHSFKLNWLNGLNIHVYKWYYSINNQFYFVQYNIWIENGRILSFFSLQDAENSFQASLQEKELEFEEKVVEACNVHGCAYK